MILSRAVCRGERRLNGAESGKHSAPPHPSARALLFFLAFIRFAVLRIEPVLRDKICGTRQLFVGKICMSS
jgi:hypothetical protein